MKRIASIVAGLFLALSLTSVALAAPPSDATLALNDATPVASGTSVTFTVTNYDGIRNPIVVLDCNGSPYDYFSYLDTNGVTNSTLPVSGTSCTAWVARHPAYNQIRSNEVTFAVTP